MRLVVARCQVDYAGRLTAHLPMAKRVLMIKADGSVLVHSDGGSYKPLNWMSPPCSVREGVNDDGQVEWVVTGKDGDTLRILIEDIQHDSSHELGVDPGLQKDGVEKHLQELLAEHPATLADGLTLVRREYPTAIGPVDLMCRDAAGASVAVEIKRRGEIDGVEQLTRYLELLNRDPLLAPVRGIFAAQEIKPQARVLADRPRHRLRGRRLRRPARAGRPDHRLFCSSPRSPQESRDLRHMAAVEPWRPCDGSVRSSMPMSRPEMERTDSSQNTQRHRCPIYDTARRRWRRPLRLDAIGRGSAALDARCSTRTTARFDAHDARFDAARRAVRRAIDARFDSIGRGNVYGDPAPPRRPDWYSERRPAATMTGADLPRGDSRRLGSGPGDGAYTTSTYGVTLEQEGFIHASRADQWEAVRERFYADVDEPLVLLEIDTDLLDVPSSRSRRRRASRRRSRTSTGRSSRQAVVGVIRRCD